jgi:hypothetical protein
MTRPARPVVLYLAGVGRSGSTLLANLLGQLPGVINVGEASRYLSNAAMSDRDLPCGCGRPLARCDFWSGLDAGEVAGMREFGTRLLRFRYLPCLLRPALLPGFERRLASYRRSLGGLYRGIAERSGCAVIVDSSKSPTNALALSGVDGVDLHLVHLVRDPRGVASSWRRPKQYLRARSPLRVLAWWFAFNLAAETLRSRATSYTLVRYEEFSRDPRAVLAGLARRCGLTDPVDHVVDGGRARWQTQHDIAGNPDKFRTGAVTIREQSWALPQAWRLGLGLATLPLRSRYDRRSRLEGPGVAWERA